MSDAMKFEDYLRQKAYSYGADTRGVIIPKNIALGIASWIEQERSKNRWIPVSERLPEKEGRYLTTCSKWGAWAVDWNIWAGSPKASWLWEQGVIAWMSMPDPYEEEEIE